MKTHLLILLFLLASHPAARAIRPQEQTNWCWAACVQDVMAQAGVDVSQAAIVARFSGQVLNRPANIVELVHLLRSFNFRAWQAGRPGSPEELYSSLSRGLRLIAFVRPTEGPIGHFIVLQGYDPRTGMIIVSDPWTGQTNALPPPALYAWWRWGDSILVAPRAGM